MSKRIFTLEQEKEIILKYKDIQNITTIANEYNTSCNTINRILRRNNIKIINNLDISQRLSLEQIQDIIFRYNNNETYKTISDVYNIKSDTVKNILIRNNIDTSKSNKIKITSEKENEILLKYKETLNRKETAEACDTSVSSVTSVLDKNNIKSEKCKGFLLEHEQDIVSRYNETKSVNKVSKEYNASRDTIYRILNKHGVETEKLIKLSKEQEEEIVKEYKNNKTYNEIRDKYHTSNGTIMKILNEHNLINRTKKLSIEQEDEIIMLYNEGISMDIIGERYNVDSSMISRMFKRRGIEAKSYGYYLKHSVGQIKELLKLYNYDMITDKDDDDKIGYYDKVSFIDNIGYMYYVSLYVFLTKPNSKFLLIHVSNKYTINNINVWIKLNNKPYKLLSTKYCHSNSPLDFYCPECDKKFKMTWNRIYRHHNCPHCSESKGESAISNYLLSNEIIYEQEYKFNDCRGKKYPLPFDFAIFKNNILSYLIEYDGQMHYLAVDFFGGEEKLKLTQERDKIKTEYCIKNNIPLLRIPYWDFDNITTILNKELIEYLDK